MISRVADHAFWFGRYLERAESTARVLMVTSSLALDAELTAEQCWLPVVIVFGEEARFPAASADGDGVQKYMAWSEDNLASIYRSVVAARENARSIREVVSLEVWEVTNELYLWMTSPAARDEYAQNRWGFYRQVRRQVQLCLGLLENTMLHDTPLDFIWLGVILERLGQTARVLDVHHHAFTTALAEPLAPLSDGARSSRPLALARHRQVVEEALWLSLLRACSGFEPFMKRNQGKVSGAAVAAFLLLEGSFPRSIRYCIEAGHERLLAIRSPGVNGGANGGVNGLPGGACVARMGALAAWIRERSPGALGGPIHDLLTHVVDETAAVCEGISSELFGIELAPPPPVR